MTTRDARIVTAAIIFAAGAFIGEHGYFWMPVILGAAAGILLLPVGKDDLR